MSLLNLVLECNIGGWCDARQYGPTSLTYTQKSGQGGSLVPGEHGGKPPKPYKHVPVVDTGNINADAIGYTPHHQGKYMHGFNTQKHMPIGDIESSDTDDAGYPPRRRSRRTNMLKLARSLPKTLTFNGTGNWLTFKQRFTRYANACKWSSEECLESVDWCLAGKAADFQTILLEREPKM